MRKTNRLNRYSLNTSERMIIASACMAPGYDGLSSLGQEATVRAAADASRRLYPLLPDLVSRMDHLRGEQGPRLLLLEQLPQVEIPLRLAAVVGSLLGRVTRYEGEGEYVIEVKEQATKPGDRPAFSNSREFYLHTDLSYSLDPPQFMLLYTLVNDANDGGFSELGDVEPALARLSDDCIAELQKDQFLFPAPPHYRGQAVVQFPILTRPRADGPWQVRFRRDNLRARTRSGMEAVAKLVQAFNDTVQETALAPDSMILVNNRSVLHGRTAFLGQQPAKEPRCLYRLYVNRTEGI